MLIGALRLPDANGENLVCGNQHHLSFADLKDFAVILWSELKIILSDCCFAVAKQLSTEFAAFMLHLRRKEV